MRSTGHRTQAGKVATEMIGRLRSARDGERELGQAIQRGAYDHYTQRTGVLLRATDSYIELFDLGTPDLARPRGNPYDTTWRTTMQAMLHAPADATDSWLLENEQDAIVVWTDKRWDTIWHKARSYDSWNEPASQLVRQIGGQPAAEIHGDVVVTGANLLGPHGFQIRPLATRWVNIFREQRPSEHSRPQHQDQVSTQRQVQHAEVDVQRMAAIVIGNEARFLMMGSTPAEWEAWVQEAARDLRIPSEDLMFVSIGTDGLTYASSQRHQMAKDWDARSPLATMTMIDIESGGDALEMLAGLAARMIFGPVIVFSVSQDLRDGRYFPTPLRQTHLEKLVEQATFARNLAKR